MPETNWTEDEIANLKRCIEAGVSMRAAAVVMGRSFNSVNGKAKRIGLAFRAERTKPTKNYLSEKEAAKHGITLANNAIVAEETQKPKPRLAEIVERVPTPFELLEEVVFQEVGVAIWALEDNQCRAIVAGDPQDAYSVRYCGDPTRMRRSWCAAHTAQYTTPWSQEKERRAMRREERQQAQAKLGRWS